MTTDLLRPMATDRVHDAAEDPTQTAVARVSARFGVAFAACQLAVMVAMVILVLPHGGAPGDPPLERGLAVLDAETAYRMGNYAFMAAGVLLLGFLGVVHQRLRRVDGTGILSTVAVASGTLLALIWPLAGALHDVALDAASAGTDPRILAGWDSVAPFSLAFSALVRIFFIGSVVVGLRLAGTTPRLARLGVGLAALSLVGSATLLTAALFPVLAVSTLGYELWVAAVAWHWLRRS
jgi:hypothetical protein